MKSWNSDKITEWADRVLPTDAAQAMKRVAPMLNGPELAAMTHSRLTSLGIKDKDLRRRILQGVKATKPTKKRSVSESRRSVVLTTALARTSEAAKKSKPLRRAESLRKMHGKMPDWARGLGSKDTLSRSQSVPRSYGQKLRRLPSRQRASVLSHRATHSKLVGVPVFVKTSGTSYGGSKLTSEASGLSAESTRRKKEQSAHIVKLKNALKQVENLSSKMDDEAKSMEERVVAAREARVAQERGDVEAEEEEQQQERVAEKTEYQSLKSQMKDFNQAIEEGMDQLEEDDDIAEDAIANARSICRTHLQMDREQRRKNARLLKSVQAELEGSKTREGQARLRRQRDLGIGKVRKNIAGMTEAELLKFTPKFGRSGYGTSKSPRRKKSKSRARRGSRRGPPAYGAKKKSFSPKKTTKKPSSSTRSKAKTPRRRGATPNTKRGRLVATRRGVKLPAYNPKSSVRLGSVQHRSPKAYTPSNPRAQAATAGSRTVERGFRLARLRARLAPSGREVAGIGQDAEGGEDPYQEDQIDQEQGETTRSRQGSMVGVED